MAASTINASAGLAPGSAPSQAQAPADPWSVVSSTPFTPPLSPPSAPAEHSGNDPWAVVGTALVSTAAPGVQDAPSSQSQPAPTVSAVPDNTLPDKIRNWANSVSGDIKYGTDVTGVGHVLKAMGAHGVYSGNSKEVGDFMASLPLGLSKLVKGEAETAQSGNRIQGVKDVVGGAVDASTIPSGFIAPEASEAISTGMGQSIEAGMHGASSAVDAAGQAASKAKQAITAPINKAAAQSGLQQGLRDVLKTVAGDAGV